MNPVGLTAKPKMYDVTGLGNRSEKDPVYNYIVATSIASRCFCFSCTWKVYSFAQSGVRKQKLRMVWSYMPQRIKISLLRDFSNSYFAPGDESTSQLEERRTCDRDPNRERENGNGNGNGV